MIIIKRITLLLLLFFCWTINLFAQQMQNKQDSGSGNEQYNTYYDNRKYGDFDALKSHLENITKAIINVNPETYYNEYYNKSIEYFNEQNYNKAIEYSKWFIERHANDKKTPEETVSEACFLTGLAYKSTQEYDLAIEYFKKSMDKDSLTRHTWHFSYYQIGNCYYDKFSESDFDYDSYFSAICYYNKALENPLSEYYSELIYTQIGDCYFTRSSRTNYFYTQDIDSALRYYHKAIKQNPYYPDVYNSIGNLYYTEQKFDSAIVYYSKVIELLNHRQPYTYELHKNVTQTVYAQPNYYAIGDSYLCKGQKETDSDKAIECYDKAIGYYNRVIELFPDKESAFYFFLGEAYFNKKNHSIAIKYFNKMISMADTNALLPTIDFDDIYYNYLFIGGIYLQTDCYDKVIYYCEKAIDMNPNDIRAYLLIGDAYFSKRNYEKTIYYYKEAINIAPTYDVDIYLYVAAAYYNQQNYDEALLYSKRAIKLDSINIGAHLLIGDVYSQKGYDKDASVHYQKVIDNFQQETLFLFSIGASAKKFQKMGDDYWDKAKYRDAAIKCYQIAAKLGNEQLQQWLTKNGYGY